MEISFVAFVERFSADDFTVASGKREIVRGFAGSFPGGGCVGDGEGGIGEATEFRPDSGVEDTDDDVIGVVRVRP